MKAVLILTLLAVLAAGCWAMTAYEHGLAHFLGVDTQQSQNYDFTSGIGPMILAALNMTALFTLAGTTWHVLNCHADRCPRIGRFHVAGGKFRVCGRHHQQVTGHPRKITADLLRAEHALHLERLHHRGDDAPPP